MLENIYWMFTVFQVLLHILWIYQEIEFLQQPFKGSEIVLLHFMDMQTQRRASHLSEFISFLGITSFCTD